MPEEKKAETRARTIIEKKSAINLIEAFAFVIIFAKLFWLILDSPRVPFIRVSLKHYLRGEEGIYYEDLYDLVKYLPAYALPAGRPSVSLAGSPSYRDINIERTQSRRSVRVSQPSSPSTAHDVPLPTLNMTSPTPAGSQRGMTTDTSMSVDLEKAEMGTGATLAPPTGQSQEGTRGPDLQPAWNPPEYALFDVFPFSLFVKALQKRGRVVKGKKSARLRARGKIVNHNVPLELTLYLVSGSHGLCTAYDLRLAKHSYP